MKRTERSPQRKDESDGEERNIADDVEVGGEEPADGHVAWPEAHQEGDYNGTESPGNVGELEFVGDVEIVSDVSDFEHSKGKEDVLCENKDKRENEGNVDL